MSDVYKVAIVCVDVFQSSDMGLSVIRKTEQPRISCLLDYESLRLRVAWSRVFANPQSQYERTH